MMSDETKYKLIEQCSIQVSEALKQFLQCPDDERTRNAITNTIRYEIDNFNYKNCLSMENRMVCWALCLEKYMFKVGTIEDYRLWVEENFVPKFRTA